MSGDGPGAIKEKKKKEEWEDSELRVLVPGEVAQLGESVGKQGGSLRLLKEKMFLDDIC